MKRVQLSPRELGPALRRLGADMDKACVRAFQNAARYGATMVLQTSAKTIPRPRARGTYERSWVVTKLPDGAALSNAAPHAVFVERGRKRGRLPPVKSILEWMQAKQLTKKLGPHASRRVAYLIAKKIGAKGVKGRYVLKRTMPAIAKRVLFELTIEMRRAFDRQG